MPSISFLREFHNNEDSILYVEKWPYPLYRIPLPTSTGKQIFKHQRAPVTELFGKAKQKCTDKNCGTHVCYTDWS